VRRGAGGASAVPALAAVVGTVVLGLGLGTAGAGEPPRGLFQPLAPTFRAATLTRNGLDTYGLTTGNGFVTATGTATNTDSNSRGVFWPRGQQPLAKQQSCATLSGKVGPVVQMGLALRLARTPRGAIRAITVTNNVYGSPLHQPTWVFNVHVWRSDLVPPFLPVGGFDLAPALSAGGVPRPFPWRICARVQGRLLMFQAWPAAEPAPPWSDPDHGGTIRLPQGTGYAGGAGWYVGHLFAGDAATYRDLVSGAPTVRPG
jgi:hypothetical protein